MARNSAVAIENNFVNGFISEATALNFPEAAATEADNCIFWEKGNVTRRPGMDQEYGGTSQSYVSANLAKKTYLWRNAAGNGDYNFVVVQIGNVLHFYRVSDTGSLSNSVLVSTIGLTIFGTGTGIDTSTIECNFADGYGYLFVTNPYLYPMYVKYDPATNAVTATYIEILTRDTVGIQDVYSQNGNIEVSPTALTTEHYYNLFNQGWLPAYTTAYYTALTSYPSNAMVWWLLKDATETFTPSLALSNYRGNAQAPRGKVIMPAFAQDRSTFTGIPGISLEFGHSYSHGRRPACCAFFAGRVFYAGVPWQGFSNKIYFSQVVQHEANIGKCYQVNDPTSEFQFDLLATDGGEVTILDAGTIVQLFSISGSLIVFATNGVWSISGSTGTGFSATDFTVKKLSSVPSLSSSTFVDVAGFPAWWNADGVYSISSADALGQVQVSSMTDKKIKTWFNETIPPESKKWARGFYNPLTRVVQFLYRSSSPLTVQDRYEYDRILCFNTLTGAFYVHTIDITNVKLNGIISIQGQGSITVGDMTTAKTQASVFKYLTSVNESPTNASFTFSELNNYNYEDWSAFGHTTDYESYLISGYKVHGDAQKKFQANYIYVFMKNELDPHVDLQAIWDYAATPDHGEWSNKQRIAFSNLERTIDWKRLKLRGTGLSLQLRLSSVAGKPFDVHGWTAWETGNAQI